MAQRQITIRLSDEHLRHLDAIAKEAGKPRASVASSILQHVIDDDASAHGLVSPSQANAA